MLSTRLIKAWSFTSRLVSTMTNTEIIQHRARLFDEEKSRQLKEIERIEKIEVIVEDQENKQVKLIMNKDLSTPFNCAMHLSEILCKRSALALVDGTSLWDMNYPLKNSCSLKFLHFKDEDPFNVNLAYWRSCSFILGYLIETAFKDKYFVDLCSFPPPDIKSGSFIYDAKLNIQNWKPSKEELRCLSIMVSKLVAQKLQFEKLKISPEIAMKMFKYNKFKLEQIPAILSIQKSKSESDNLISVYKLGDYVDISKGPMISSTEMIGRFEVTNIFDIETENYGQIQRIQGISIPAQLQLHYWTFNLLAERAAKLNSALKPTLLNQNRMSN
ncbi:39S ribosomal mitochondrial [Brachionus plicatilis]|uniref:39S ribosomal mitochondrial n=1 Tax=Brachionus plicatilis TaxID=10195 RepID=A0A3M7TA82_BRAPC|nr:39S ribosomal mitochondrial [Brachionus plicatilis]